MIVQIGRPTLASLTVGQSGKIASIKADVSLKRRLYELGLTPGTPVTLKRKAPLGDPLEIEVRGYRLSLRGEEAKAVTLGDFGRTPHFYSLGSKVPRVMPQTLRVGLIGNPNAGKSTLFNALTGRHVTTGNYPGITVSRHIGRFDLGTLVDLPGLYSLHGRSPDEDVAAAELLQLPLFGTPEPLDAIIVVADATAIERSAYLLLQVRDCGVPVVVALNMIDEADALGVRIDVAKLSQTLGLAVVPVVAKKRQGLDALKAAVRASTHAYGSRERAIEEREQASVDLVLARYAYIDEHIAPLVTRRQQARLTDKVDTVLTHPLWGSIALLAILAFVFSTLFTFSQPLMNGIEAVFTALSEACKPYLPAVITDGLLQGVGTVLAFLPQIVALLFFMTFLEALGYLSRAAFLIDRLMRLVGLNGKAFVPMLSGYACAVPAILSLRTLESERDRKLTMAVLPLTTCSARLPVYTLIIAVMFPDQPGTAALLLFTLYVTSAVLAMLAAGVIGRTALKGIATTMVLELPPYRMPAWRPLAHTIWRRSKDFLSTAGTTIIVLSCVMWVLMHYPKEGEQSIAGQVGHAMAPVIRPLGFDWKIGVGLIGSFAAREVFIATMAVVHGTEEGTLAEAMRDDKHADGTPVYTFKSGLSLLCFMMLACQCMSTLAVIKRETHSWRWPVYIFSYMTALAYLVSFAINQLG